jgi:outer membrane immunogenic protein
MLYNWTGFYLGANVGYGWSDGSGTLTAGAVTIPINGSGDGVLGGVQAGYNWQMNQFVFGIETDFQLSDGKGNVTSGGVVVGNASNDWFGTIRGRVGYAFDRWLLYVTGGGAYSHNKLTSVPAGLSAEATGWSWTVGGGVEMALWDRWSAKLEYLFIDTPDSTPVIAGTATTGSVDTNIIRVGLNYRF